MNCRLTLLCILIAVFIYGPANAQEIPKGGKELIKAERYRNFGMKKEGLGFIRKEKELAPEHVLRCETTAKPKFIYNLSARLPISQQKVKKGDALLLTFSAKTESARLETGEAKVKWLFKQSDSYKDNLEQVISIANKWQTYFIPIEASRNIKAEDLSLVLQFGYLPQAFLLKDIRLIYYGDAVPVQQLPKTLITYAGQAEDAPWRAAALARIDSIRKSNFTLVVKDKNGQALPVAVLQIALQRHHFRWGAALRARDLLNNPSQLQHFSALFNLAVLENDLKIKWWTQDDRRAETLKVIDILKEANIDIKGHVLIWPGFNHLTEDFARMEKAPQKLQKRIQSHLEDILQKTKGQISHWDVVNEAYTNTDLQRITGSEEILYHGFRMAKTHAPEAGRFVNEFGIISKGGIDEKKQQWYYDYIKRIDKITDGLVEGIGIQSHMGSDLTPPERVLEILDYYGTLGKKISISEFTMEVQDPVLRRQYTRDFIIAAFSHPSVNEFLFWGFYEPTHPKADIFDKNWELGSMGQAFYYLTQQLWKTQIVAPTNAEGEIKGRGFYGTYDYSFMHNNRLQKGTFELRPDGPAEINIQVK